MARILVVDDEAMIRNVIKEYSIFEGNEVREAENGREAIEWCKKEDFDVIVMDLMMPGLDGFTTYEVIKEIKDIPVLILSAKGAEYDKLYGFRLGIDDYVVKPFSPRELMARLNVIISRHGAAKTAGEKKDAGQLVYGDLVIDKAMRMVYVTGSPIDGLTRKEFDLLFYLASNPKKIHTRENLLNQIWGFDYVGDGRTVDTHVKMLRHKLGKCRDYIITVRGVGYKFDAGE